MKKRILKNESGRSMVEMLGVLAVIGVLTIIGIAGFRYAMNKHYANQTVDRLMRRAVVVAAQAQFGQNLSLHEFNENDGEYPIPTTGLSHDTESFTLTVNEVPEAVCQLIVGLDWKMAKIIPENCSDTSMKFKFLNELGDCSLCQAESVDCPPDEELECGSCSVVRGFLDNDSDCEDNENGANCVQGKCSKCKDGKFWYTNGKYCVTCQNINGYWGTSSEYRHRCLGLMYYDSSDSLLRGCIDTNDRGWKAEETSCKACENRCFYTHDNSCRLIDQAYKRNEDGTCSCTETANSSVYQGNCYYCDVGTLLSKSQFKCVSCDATTSWGTIPTYAHHCMGTMFFAPNTLYGCLRTDTGKNADETSCKACENRCFHTNDNSCRLINQAYQRNEDGTCSCTETANSSVYQGNCYYCDVGTLLSKSQFKCVSCDATTSWGTIPTYAHHCMGTMFFASNALYGCLRTDTGKNADETSCKACENRCYLNGNCYLYGEGYTYRYKDADGNCTDTAPN